MFLSIVLSIFVSLFLIVLGHRIWNGIKDQFSVKKSDYVVRSQIDKYRAIVEEWNNPPPPPEDPGTADLKSDLEDFLNGM